MRIAAAALVLTILVRAAYVAPLLGALKVQAIRGTRIKPHIDTMQDRLEDPDTAGTAFDGMRGWGRTPPAEGSTGCAPGCGGGRYEVFFGEADEPLVATPAGKPADPVADGVPRAPGPQLLDDADEVEAGREREGGGPHADAPAQEDVVEGDPRGQDPHLRLPGRGDGLRLLHYLQRPAGFLEDHLLVHRNLLARIWHP